jgi:aspartyl-tRNA(Asn)/glutamyl-tRNA(Gln) amidotransferase subunit B
MSSVNTSAKKGWMADIGLEIHVQLLTKSKLFSSDGNDFTSGDNQNISEVTLGLPGALPVLNREALSMAVKLGLAVEGKLKEQSRFERKNYFYPDMPKNYQITQLREPFCEGGKVKFFVEGKVTEVNLHHAHLEEDAGKSIHREEHSLINYNRAGAPLIEIVSEPDMHSGSEAAEYAKMVHRIVRHLNICDGNMEEGSFRADCNVSVRRVGQKELGTKVEIKNLNSFRFIEKAIEYEIQRQIDLLESSESIIQETRLYDSAKNTTSGMRRKEEAKDYRYFPDPDLPVLTIARDFIEGTKKKMPAHPFKILESLTAEIGLGIDEAQTLVDEPSHLAFFEQTNAVVKDPRLVASWFLSEVKALTGEPSKNLSIKQFSELLLLVQEKKISGKMGKEILRLIWGTPKMPSQVITEQGFSQVTDDSQIRNFVNAVLSKNADKVAEFNSGKDKLFGFFVGQVMKESKGQANPDLVNKILLEELKKGTK